MRSFIMFTKDLLLRGGAAAGGFLYGLEHSGKASAVLLAVLMIAEHISGIAAAALSGTAAASHESEPVAFLSRINAKGLWRKAMIIIVVAVAYALDWFINKDNTMFSSAAVWFYISSEGLSVLENLAKSGIPVPRRLKQFFEALRKPGLAKPGSAEDLVNPNK